MKPLSTLRAEESDTRAIETAMTRALTVAAGVAAYRSLHSAFAYQLDATEHLFRPDREHHLRQLQATLRRLLEVHDDA
jgi:hypothetical protein